MLMFAGSAIQFHWSGLFTMICFCVYGFFFQFWGLIAWVYPAEIFSMAEKDKAVSLAVFLQYATNAGVVSLTPHLMSISVPVTLFFFGLLNVVILVFVWSLVKETKGLTIEDAPNLF